MTEHMHRKHCLENMSRAEIEAALSSIALSEDERAVMEMLYIKNRQKNRQTDKYARICTNMQTTANITEKRRISTI